MIYIAHPGTDVALHLAAEYYFATEKKLPETVFMLWQSAPTLVVGRFQNTYEEINLRYAEEKGIAIVRRMSGGGTVYQDRGGRQFAFIDQAAGEGIDFTSYLRPIVRALCALGVPAEINGRNDLCCEGKKFSGNAQYRQKGTTVHHGTLLFDTDIAEMVAATSPDPYKISSKSIKSVKDRVINLKTYLPDMDAEAFGETVVEAVLGEGGGRYTLTEEDDRRIAQIADEIFRPWDFRFGNNPKFDLVKTGRFPGGKVELHLNIERGHIAALDIHGDFFSSLSPAQIAQTLVGTRFEPQAIEAALAPLQGKLYGISAKDLSSLLAE